MSFGIGMFGLVDPIDREFNGSTKPGYTTGPIAPHFEREIDIQKNNIFSYNDGTIEALAEYHHGSGLDWKQEERKHKELFYLRIKDYGIVGASISDGNPTEGPNPEIGHSLAQKHPPIL